MSFQDPFYSDEEEDSNTPKADALFIPKENPRALFIRPIEREKLAPPKDVPTPLLLLEDGKLGFLQFIGLLHVCSLVFNVQKRFGVLYQSSFYGKESHIGS